MADQDIRSPAWRAFADKLIRERREAVATSTASESFVKRMTSSAADPDAALGEADGNAGKPAGATPAAQG